MSGDDQALSFVYLVGCLVLVATALAVRRIPIGQSLKMAIAWVLIFVAAFAAFTLKDDFIDLGKRVIAEGRGQPVTVEEGGVVRIRQSSDGHYWVNASVNGVELRFLVDSGATITSISGASAQRAGIDPGDSLPVAVETANGRLLVRAARADTLKLGPIERQGLAVHVSDGFGDTNVLGMNFLSSLSSWGVEKRWLILRP